ncbi:hypothetical protein [Halocalculus aciditolerans]|uniref:Uncharacterized protein n=1 Tax=Halocalculus aciditolerans TaxID=1383812 RepID=A0A830FGX3_9EURY|nr:hypothetical protein [Halocalculus aciditolerans]GGL73323.1 hypothetical protein GCM10009039_34310 [Halocalculus aciditolerans]
MRYVLGAWFLLVVGMLFGLALVGVVAVVSVLIGRPVSTFERHVASTLLAGIPAGGAGCTAWFAARWLTEWAGIGGGFVIGFVAMTLVVGWVSSRMRGLADDVVDEVSALADI